MGTLSDYVYHRDFVGRIPFAIGPLTVRLAAHLEQDPLLVHAEPILSVLSKGQDFSSHVSPMKAVRAAFKKATRNGDWSRYSRMMDLLLNKWGVFHFHADNSRKLVFVYLCARSSTAYLVDIRGHDGNWKLERHLISIIAENWPDAGILREVARGSSCLTEADLLEARRRGLNMPIEVHGRFYLPSSRGLMMDGSGYDSHTGIVPVVVTAKRFDPTSTDEEAVKSPQVMMVGVDPDDPRPPWIVGAAEAGALAAQRREATTGSSAQEREARLRHGAHMLFGKHVR